MAKSVKTVTPTKLTKSGKIDQRTTGALRKPRKIDADKVLELKGNGMSNADIALHQDVTPAAVWKFLHKHSPEYQELQLFKDNSADFLAHDRFETRKERVRIRKMMADTSDKDLKEISYAGKQRIHKELYSSESKMAEDELTSRDGRPVQQNFFQINLTVTEARQAREAAQAELDGN